MSSAALRRMRERVARLDERVGVLGADERWEQVVEVMSWYTDTALGGGVEQLALTPHEADSLAESSLMLGLLREERPDIVVGPLDRERQQWVSTGGRAASGGTPSRRFFVDVSASGAHTEQAPTFGLFTSTSIPTQASTLAALAAPVGRRPGMWQRYLDPYAGSDLFPFPWRVWTLRAHPDTEVAEIDSAASWARFVHRYPRRSGTVISLDWAAAAQDWDGVHLSLAAVVAAQSWYLRSPGGDDVTAPVYWDVESTLWLRWVFGDPEPVETRTI